MLVLNCSSNEEMECVRRKLFKVVLQFLLSRFSRFILEERSLMLQ